VSVALVKQYAMRTVHVPYCNLWPARLCYAFPHYLTNDKIFEKKKIVIEHEICVLISSATLG